MALAIAWLAASVLLYAKQDALLYNPSPLRAVPDAQRLAVIGSTGPLRGWVVNPDETDALVYFGGKGEPLERDVDFFRTTLPGRSVYLVPYRGYGPNTGKPSEKGIEADALAEFDVARGRHVHVAVAGRSLGTGVATFVAAHRPVERVVLVTPYDSILNIARGRYPIFPVSLLLRDRYESSRNADAITAPTLVLIAADDESIPRASTDALIAHFHTPPSIVVVPHAGHNSISKSPLYVPSIRDFLASPLPSSPPARTR